MTIFITIIPILRHNLAFSSVKVYYFAPKAGVFSIVKPDVSQWEATFQNDVGLAAVYCRIYHRSLNFDPMPTLVSSELVGHFVRNDGREIL